MNYTYNRDMKYTFIKRWYFAFLNFTFLKKYFSNKLIHSSLIDEDWIKEKNIDMEIIIPSKNYEIFEEEGGKSAELKNWNDTGFEDLIGRNLYYTDLNLK